MKKKIVFDAITFAYIFLFAYTATSKLFQPEKFKRAVAKSPLIAPFTDLIAWGIPTLEIGIVLCLLFPRTRRIGLYACSCLMVLFTGYIAYMIAFTPKLPCTCGGIIQLMSWRGHLLFNTVFAALAGWALWLDKHQLPLEARAPTSAYV